MAQEDRADALTIGSLYQSLSTSASYSKSVPIKVLYILVFALANTPQQWCMLNAGKKKSHGVLGTKSGFNKRLLNLQA